MTKTKLLQFTKMQSLGNDFILLDLRSQPEVASILTPEQIRFLADRHFGIGCDQVLILEPPLNAECNFRFRAFNPDGHEAEQCGNGLRCAGYYLATLTNLPTTTANASPKNNFIADCMLGRNSIRMEGENVVSVNLGKPKSAVATYKIDANIRLDNLPSHLTNTTNLNSVTASNSRSISDLICATNNEIYSLSLGNPHGICVVKDLDSVSVSTWGEKLSTLRCFPEQANITFMQVVSTSELKLAIYERGAGPTLACGTGASAAAFVAYSFGLTTNKTNARFKHGHVTINIDRESQHIHLSGPANRVFSGNINVEVK